MIISLVYDIKTDGIMLSATCFLMVELKKFKEKLLIQNMLPACE